MFRRKSAKNVTQAINHLSFVLSNAQHVKTPNMRSKLPIFLYHEIGKFSTFLFSFVAYIVIIGV
jgi:hypothetical protein